MLALAHWEGGLCRRCGEHLSRAMDPMTDPDRPEATSAWVADGPYECHCCKALAKADAALQKQEGGPELAAYSVHTPALVPKTPKVRKKR